MCNLSCKTKIIVNGDNAAKALGTLCEQVEWARDHDVELPHGEQLIVLLNKIEDDVFKAQTMFLKDIGYNGPWPNAMK